MRNGVEFAVAAASALSSGTSTYRVHTPAFAILTIEDDRVPVTIPVNAYIHPHNLRSSSEDTALVRVGWDERMLLMFAQDVRSRTTFIKQEHGAEQ